jgi:hypothetical protein
LEEVESLGVGDIDTVEEGQQVQKDNEGKDVQVDPGHKLPLRRVGRALDPELLIVLP